MKPPPDSAGPETEPLPGPPARVRDLFLLEAAFAEAPIAMGVVDDRGRYRRVNGALCRLLGRTEHELLARTYHDFFHPDDTAAEQERLARLVRGDIAAYESEDRRLRPDGSVVWVHEFVSAAFGADGAPPASCGADHSRYVLRQLVDLTSLRELTLALEDARQAAVTAGRKALEANLAKTEFLSRVSHQLRTPLTAMLGFAELLEGEHLAPRPAGQLAHIVVAGQHLLGLVNELLDLARVEQGRLELSLRPVATGDVIAEVRSLVESDAAAAGLTFSAPTTAIQLAVLADHGRLVEILLNLLSNAIKFSTAGGTVALSAAAGEGRVSITVADTGPGLTGEQQSRLFMPFERLGAEQRGIPGTGLGLAVSRRLAEAMGGELAVASQPGQGSAFTVSLPAAHLGEVAELPAPTTPVWSDARHGVLRSRRWSILYVEDDPINARLVDAVLARFCDVDLTVASTGTQGLKWAAAGTFDLVLLDLTLPDMRGIEVLEQLRADPATTGLPVVILTADASAARSCELLRAGAQGFEGKPISVRSFLDTLADVLARPAGGGQHTAPGWQ